MNNKIFFFLLLLTSMTFASEETINIESQVVETPLEENTPTNSNAKQQRSLWSMLKVSNSPTRLEVEFHDQKSKCEQGLSYTVQLCQIVSIGITGIVSVATLILMIVNTAKGSSCSQ